MRSRRFAMLFLAFPFVFASFAFAQTLTPPLALATADWSVEKVKVLNSASDDSVWKFMNNQWGNTDLNPGNGKLCEFHFVNLRHSGELSLVAVYDGGGTVDCNDLEVFDKGPTGFSIYDFDTTQDVSLNANKDLNGDGHNELIVDAGLAGGGGADHCIATWPVVYAWNGSGYADVSREFKNYYRKTLSDLQRQIIPLPPIARPEQAQTIETAPPGGSGKFFPGRSVEPPQPVPARTPDSGLDCVKAEAAKIQRFLGTSHDAGMGDALKWANSTNARDRIFATFILGDIGTPEAKRYLKTLRNDADRNVAMSAKDFLTPAADGPSVNPTIQATH
jgi:hypothetical protein